MTFLYTVTEEKEFKFELKDIVDLAIESMHKSGFTITDPIDIYNDIYDNIYFYLESLGLPDNAYDGDGIPVWIADEIMEEVDKYIKQNSEKL